MCQLNARLNALPELWKFRKISLSEKIRKVGIEVDVVDARQGKRDLQGRDHISVVSQIERCLSSENSVCCLISLKDIIKLVHPSLLGPFDSSLQPTLNGSVGDFYLSIGLRVAN